MGLFGGILGLIAPLVGDLFGSSNSSSAVSQASAAQVAAQQQALAEQQREYNTSRSDFQPFMQFGTGSLGQLGDLLGLNGSDKSAAAIGALKSSPLYTSLFNTGKESVLQNASATGGVRGGNTEGSLYELGSNTLAQVVQQQIQNLFGAAGIGEGSTGAAAAAGQHSADAMGSIYGSIGQAQAGNYLGQAGITNNLTNQIAALFSPSNMSSLGIKI